VFVRVLPTPLDPLFVSQFRALKRAMELGFNVADGFEDVEPW
jgi:hypothetical protein